MRSFPSESVHMAVQSTLLSWLTYSSDATLELQFCKGAIYRYFAVPTVVVQGLLDSASKGAFFNRYIRHHFRYQRLA